jgi:hypothetical protein
MSAIKVIRALLLADADVVAIVGQRVFAGIVPQGSALPLLQLREVSRVERLTTGLTESTVLVTARVQVTALTKTYGSQKALLQAARLGAGAHTGVIAGVPVRAITRELFGPDMSDLETEIYEQSRDFKVIFTEPN